MKNILLIFIVAIIGMLSYFINPYNENDDTQYHMVNILEFKNQFLENPFNTKIVGGIANDFGYGTRLFYPPLAHTSVALIDIVIDNIEISFKAFNFLIVFLSGLAIYYLAKKIFENDKISVLAAIIYMLFPYHLSDVFIRDALAETLVFVFIPIILNAIYSLFYKEGKNFYLLFVVGYAGGILSHATMMMYFTFLIVIFLMINFKKTFSKQVFFKLLYASLFVLGLTSFFWVPMLEHNLFGNYLVFKEGVMVEGTQGNGLFLYEYFDYFSKDPIRIKFYIDLVVVFLLIVSLVKLIKEKEVKGFNFYIILLGAVAIYMSTIVFPWDIFPKSLRVIQFPWRMVTYACLFISLIAPICMKNARNGMFYGTIVLLLLSSFISFNNVPQKELDGYNYYVAMGWQQEYLPVTTGENMDYFNNRGNVITGNGEAYIIENNVPYLKFEVIESGILELPRLYYLGYTLINENNEEIEIYENDYGFIEANIEKGVYTLEYTKTTANKAAEVVSLMSLISIGVLRWKKLV